MTFFTRVSRPPTVPAPAGDHFIPTYERRVGADGTIGLEKTGKKNIFLEIQEGRAGLTPYEVLDRYGRSPDPAILKQQEKMYADLTSAPRSLAELEQFRIDSRNAFNSLPAGVRKIFDNNFQVFMAHSELAEKVFYEFSEEGRKAAREAAGGSAPGSAGSVPGSGTGNGNGGKAE